MTTQPGTHIPRWTLGDRLRKAREDAGYSQAELAELVGVSRNTIGNAEVGARHPLPITVRAWAQATGVPEAWLTTGRTSGPAGGGSRLPRLDSNQKPPGFWSRPGPTGLKGAA